jgi:hypothetical protein
MQKWPTLMDYFFHGSSYEIISTFNGLGHTVGDFFTDVSGHPGDVFASAPLPSPIDRKKIEAAKVSKYYITTRY